MKSVFLILLLAFCAVNSLSATPPAQQKSFIERFIEYILDKFNFRKPVTFAKAAVAQTGNLLPTVPKVDTANDIRRSHFVQNVDHFADQKTQWNQIVFVNEKYYQPGGPLFIYCSSFPEQYDKYLENSELTNMAQKHGGLVYVFVPRYFNDSKPTADLSTESLQYLTVEQNLADYANIINYFKRNLAQYGPVHCIVAGFDIAGQMMLALHQTYPGLLTGVLAYSAIAEMRYEFPEYFGHIVNLITGPKTPAGCASNLNNALLQMEELYAKGDGVGLQKVFKTLEPVDTTDKYEKAYFVSTIGNMISSVYEYGSDITVSKFCSTLAIDGLPALTKLGLFVQALRPTGVQGSYKKSVEINTNINWNSEAAITGSRALSYIGCALFAFKKTSISVPNQQSTVPGDFYTKKCQDYFGKHFTAELMENAVKKNIAAFGLKPTMQNNVFFSFGDFNPFILLGVTKDLNPSSPAMVYHNYGKAADLPRITPPEATELTESKRVANELVAKWIGKA